MSRIASLAALLLTVSLAQAAQLYRWVDADGRVHYTDQPPPREARSAERKRLGDRPGTQGLPFALQEAVRKFPVVVYSSPECGDACKQGSAYLSKRGVPHTEKDARDPATGDALMKLTGGKLEVPVMTVGSSVLRGYEEGAWGRALDAAGYPSSAVLPAGTNPKKVAAKPDQPGQTEQPAQQ
jgi:hypothetical protein